MTEKITAIVIDITRHNDKLNIVTLFTPITRAHIIPLSCRKRKDGAAPALAPATTRRN